MLSFSISYLFELIIILCLQNGWTALMMAVNAELTDVVRLLIDRGANLDIQDEVAMLMNLLSFFF